MPLSQEEIIRIVEMVAMPVLGGLGTAIGFHFQRKREAATAKKILSEGTNIDADTDSKYGAMALQFSKQLLETNRKLTEMQTEIMQLNTDLSEVRSVKIQLETKYQELLAKFAIIEQEKVSQDKIIDEQRIEIDTHKLEIKRLTEEVKKLKEGKSKRGKYARDTESS